MQKQWQQLILLIRFITFDMLIQNKLLITRKIDKAKRDVVRE